MNFNTLLENSSMEKMIDIFSDEIAKCIEDTGITLGEIEGGMRDVLQKIGQKTVEKTVEKCDRKEATARCKCGRKVGYEGQRQGKVLTVFGWITYKRSYYRCADCLTGFKPVDEKLKMKPGEMSDGLFPLLALLGIQVSFDEAVKLAEQLLLLKVSDNSIRKASQKMGQQREKIEKRWIEESDWHHYMNHPKRKETPPPKRYYGSIDGVMIATKDTYRELKTIAWYEVSPLSNRQWPSRYNERIGQLEALKAKNIHYYCDIKQAESFGQLLWATGCQHKADLAEELIFVCDGAQWIWNLIQEHYPKAIQILDWYHAVEYLTPIAQALYADDEAQKVWLTLMKTELWKGKTQTVIDHCLDLCKNPAVAIWAQKAATYYQNNSQRMRYPFFCQQGYQIGSGTIESGCKQIGTMRLKRSGAMWLEDGARDIAKARSAWLSNQWHDTIDSFHSILYQEQ